MKKVIFGLVVTALLAYSCSNDESQEINNQVQNIASTARLGENKTLDNFAYAHVAISKEIINLLKSNETSLNFNDNAYQEIYKLKSEVEIKKYFEESGIKNANDLIILLKKLEKNYSLMTNQLSGYNDLSVEQKKQIIENSINNVLNKETLSVNSTSARIDCRGQWRIDIARCERNQVIGLGFSWLGGVLTGGVGGLIGAAASTTAYHYCVQDANQDLRNCD
jgi:hypothetical protein